MQIASWNVNGLRSAMRSSFCDWLSASNLDILCLQEIKIGEAQLLPGMRIIGDYTGYFNSADRKGYSGTAIYTKHKPVSMQTNALSNARFNSEGRSQLLNFGTFSLLNLYMPHGGRDQIDLPYKLDVYQQLVNFVNAYRSKPLILAGDFNIAHQEIDLARPKQNRKNIMFTPTERQQIDNLLTAGYLDSYRHIHPTRPGYTWWPYMANARQRNIGWRIDYIFVPTQFKHSFTSVSLMSGVLGSDHAPTAAELNINPQ